LSSEFYDAECAQRCNCYPVHGHVTIVCHFSAPAGAERVQAAREAKCDLAGCAPGHGAQQANHKHPRRHRRRRLCLAVVGAKDASALHSACGLCAGAIVATLQPRQRVPLCAVCTSSSSARTSCASAPSTRGTPAHSNMVAILHIMCIRHLCRLDELETANEHYLKDVRVTRVKELELELRTYYDMARQCV
jgi:hypothetical protein